MKTARIKTGRKSRSRRRLPVISAAVLIAAGSVLAAAPFVRQNRETASDDLIYSEIAENARASPEPVQVGLTAVQRPVPSIPEAAAPIESATVFPDVLPTEDLNIPEPTADDNIEPGRQTGTKSLDFGSLRRQNPDFAAWLSIPGTGIDYPVVSSDDSGYYLNHLFSGHQSKLGCLFSLSGTDYSKPSRNIAVYGHRLSSGTAMFSTLTRYKKKEYWKEHPEIRLDTPSASRVYRVFAVLNQKVGEWDASTADFPDDESFMKFIDRARSRSFYDTGVPVSPDGHILTLITCDRGYAGVQGRLLVMAVEQ